MVTLHGLPVIDRLLSYGGMKNGGAPENRTLDAFAGRSGFQDRFLVYAGRAPLNGARTRTCTWNNGR